VARTICAVGRRRGVSDRVMLAAFETAIVESGVRNLNYGDRDSGGVFQQRPSQGWGTWAQVTNVDYATNKFFDVARTRDICGPTAGQLAQCVQRSAFPLRYNQNEGNARGLMAQIGCSATGGPGPGPTGTPNEQPCASVGRCYNRDTEQCNGRPEAKVNGAFACPTQPDNVVCCVGGGAPAPSSTRNEEPCASVGHCYNKDNEQCSGSPSGTVNGAYACPTQPDNVICCMTKGGGKPPASRGMVTDEAPCSSRGFCFDQDTHSCPSGRSGDKIDGQFVCPTQKDSIICCFN